MAALNSGGEKHVKGALLSLRILHGHFFTQGVFTVRLDRFSEIGTTSSLVQKVLQQFSPNNGLLHVLGGVIINTSY